MGGYGGLGVDVKKSLLFPVCVLVAGLLTAAPAAADPGVVSGVVTAEATGQPVADACVTLFDTDQQETAAGCTGADGRYEITGVAQGYYKARATADGYSELWAYGKGSVLAADYASLPGQLGFALRQGSGTMRGRVTDGDRPAGGASVTIMNVDQHWMSTVETAADGTYAFTGLTVNTYQLRITYGDRSQFVPQRSDVFSAGTYPVGDGQVVVVDETVVPYASLRVVATDSVTGAPVTDACARLSGGGPDEQHQACTGPDGVALLTGLPPFASFYFGAWSSTGTHWQVDTTPFSGLTPGEVTEKPIAMRPAAAIVTTVRDARTKAPVADVCVEEHQAPVQGVIDRDYLNHCSDADGKLLFGPVEPGAYQLLVKPLDERYGMQWVGERGGTGDLREARTVTAVLGTQVSRPPIEMDGAGSITGVVTDRVTGAGVNQVCVYPYPVDPAGGFAFGQNCTRNGGRYTISGLGPYKWPLEYAHAGGDYAWEWSGRVADRFSAHRVLVWPGYATNANTSLVPAGGVTGHTADQHGAPAFGYIDVYNARTGDIVERTTSLVDGTNRYTVEGLATQDIKIRYYVDANCWYGGGTDFASAPSLHVDAGQTVTGIDLGPCAQREPRS
jgi:hypothetical protein